MMAILKILLLPNFAAILPLTGIIVSCPSGSISKMVPSVPSDNESAALISGILLAQLPKHSPKAKKYNPRDVLVFNL